MNPRRINAKAPIAAVLAALLLSACGSGPTSYYSRMKNTVVDAKDDLLGTRPTTAELFPEDSTPLIDINYDAADTMMGVFMPALNKNSPIYVQNFANRVDMGDRSPFGPLVADQVAARLALRGFMVTEGPAKKPAPAPAKEAPASPDGLVVTGAEGRALEKRSLEEINKARPCLLSGTYLIADKVIYVNAKIATLDNGEVLAAHSWTVPVNRNTRSLLPQIRQTGGMKPSVRTSLGGTPPSKIASPQRQVGVERDLIP